MQEPFVTIAILSHNHEKYIEKAITSVLSQNTTFSYELLLFDDGSTDNTQNIINNYFLKFPEKIKTFCFNESKGPVFRAKQIYNNCKYKYITWLDADDYWTYHSKLQIQLDFLENNPQYIGCFHDALIKNIEGTENNLQAKLQSLKRYRYYSHFNHYEDDFTPNLLISRNIIPTASLIFRNIDFNDFFNNYNFQIFSFSWAFQLEIIKNSKFKYFNRCWSVYLDHEEGLSKKFSAVKFTLNNISILKHLKNNKSYNNYSATINNCVLREYECIVIDKKNEKIIFKYMFKYLWYYLITLLWTAALYKYRYLKQLLKIK